ncbi:MAG: hypothetical protein HY289_13035 [Planctomycetes bacterium]|nr:hypothetical protein [Planctomycetota bacterium]
MSLTACLALFFVGTWLGPIGITAPPSLIMAHGPRGAEVQAALNERFAMAAPMGVHTDKAATGAFALNAAGREEMMMGKAGADTDKVDALRMANAATARGMSNRDGFVMKYENENAAKGTSAWNDRRGAFGKHLDKNPLPPKAKKDGKKGDAVAEKTERGVEYAYQFEANMLADTLLWRPTLMLETGAAEVRFDIAPGNATYRVLLLGHTATGRFGFYETRLDVLGR